MTPGVELRSLRRVASTLPVVDAAAPSKVDPRHLPLGAALNDRLGLDPAQAVPTPETATSSAVSTPPSPAPWGSGLGTLPRAELLGGEQREAAPTRAGLADGTPADSGAGEDPLPATPLSRLAGGESGTHTARASSLMTAARTPEPLNADQAAWIRDHVWTQAMRKTHAEVPHFYDTCACQYGLTHWCKEGRHDRCHRDTPLRSEATSILRRGGTHPAYFTEPYRHLADTAATGPFKTSQAYVWYGDRVCRWVCSCTDCGHHALPEDPDLYEDFEHYEDEAEGYRPIVDLHLPEPGNPLPAPGNQQLELALTVQLSLFQEVP